MSHSNSEQAPANDVPLFPLTEQRMARMREVVSQRLASLTVVLDNVHDPHNISAILRSCEIFGIQRVHLVHPENDFKVNREVSRSCERWLELIEHPTITAGLQAVRDAGFALYAADVNEESQPLESMDFTRPAALVVGAEFHGLSPETREMADAFYTVEMFGFTRSFNVSVASALSLYIAARARRDTLGCQGDLSEEEREQIYQRWVREHRERRRRQ